MSLPPTASTLLADAESVGLIGPADRHLALTLGRLHGEHDPSVLLAVALASRAPRLGHAAVDLALGLPDPVEEADQPDGSGVMPVIPDPAGWMRRVAASPLVAEVHRTSGPPPPERPLVLREGLLALQRYWAYEDVVAREVVRRAVPAADAPGDLPLAAAILTGEGSDRQRAAVAAGLTRRLTVLVGGPGTGKTRTVAALLAEILQRAQDGAPVRVALAAPTGKAAARLTEAFAEAAGSLPSAIGRLLAQSEARTVHRLLGASGDPLRPDRFHRGHRLPYDVVIVDECSMVALPLMARLLTALDPAARCVLVGDPEQLASVEAGTVLADLVASDAGLPGAVVRLVHSRRFPPDSPIARFAAAITAGDAAGATARLRAGAQGPVGAAGAVLDHLDGPASQAEIVAAVGSRLRPALRVFGEAVLAGDAAGALGALQRVRVLCAHRRGPFGVAVWNRRIAAWLGEEVPSLAPSGAVWGPGQVLMATANDDRLGLSNGDLGVVIARRSGPMVAFGTPDRVRELPLARLSGLEPAHAMTIHKSQGSEFDEVVMILPPAASRLASRELLYTGVTRARNRVTVVGPVEALQAAVARRVVRVGGLRTLLET